MLENHNWVRPFRHIIRRSQNDLNILRMFPFRELRFVAAAVAVSIAAAAVSGPMRSDRCVVLERGAIIDALVALCLADVPVHAVGRLVEIVGQADNAREHSSMSAGCARACVFIAQCRLGLLQQRQLNLTDFCGAGIKKVKQAVFFVTGKRTEFLCCVFYQRLEGQVPTLCRNAPAHDQVITA